VIFIRIRLIKLLIEIIEHIGKKSESPFIQLALLTIGSLTLFKILGLMSYESQNTNFIAQWDEWVLAINRHKFFSIDAPKNVRESPEYKNCEAKIRDDFLYEKMAESLKELSLKKKDLNLSDFRKL